MKNYVGCSGFLYPNWRGKFYPETVRRSDWLRHYSSIFNTVEINATFYRFPRISSIRAFYEQVPAGFLFSIKAHKIITHTMRLKEAKEKTIEFLDVVREGLKEKLGPVLFQLPPSFRYSEENMERVIASLPHDGNSVVEFRDAAWWNQEVYASLAANDIIFCNSDYPGMPERIIPTENTFYLRLHGRPILYKSEYSSATLHELARQIPPSARRFVYFNNTWDVAAVANAIAIREMME